MIDQNGSNENMLNHPDSSMDFGIYNERGIIRQAMMVPDCTQMDGNDHLNLAQLKGTGGGKRRTPKKKIKHKATNQEERDSMQCTEIVNYLSTIRKQRTDGRLIKEQEHKITM